MSHKDLVERLRAYVTAESMGMSYQPPICHEAADEIERLRAGLREIEKEAVGAGDYWWIRDRARRLLGEQP